MPRKQAAGLLLFRRAVGALEVLLVHPGGPLWARKDDGAWSIPKGEVEPDEDALAAARREVEEETGARPSGRFIALSPVRQTGGKIVHVWAIESDFDVLVTGVFRKWRTRVADGVELCACEAAGNLAAFPLLKSNQSLSHALTG